MKHLTKEQRYTIETMHASGYSLKDISKTISKDKSTISRELKRNCDQRNGTYRTELAEKKANERHKDKPKNIRLTEAVKLYIKDCLKLRYSPEQISGRAKVDGVECVSTEAIYLYIWADKRQGGELYKHLRSKKKKRKKRSAKKDNRGQIPNKTSIDERPSIVDEKQRFGDYEIDLVIGKGHNMALLTMNDRATGVAEIVLLTGKNAEEVKEKVIENLQSKGEIYTITSDNGKEFSKHLEIAEALKIDYYFAHPYSSWERGANENFNGLVREFFPKKHDFSLITQEQILQAVENLNNRPRKRFGFLTPNEVYLQTINNKGGVAFVT